MPLDHLDLEPAGDMVEREIRERRIRDLREEPRAEAGPARPGDLRAFAFALQHREIEADRVADQHGVVEIAGQLRPHRGEPRRGGNRGVVEAVNARRVGRDRDIGPHQTPQGRFVGDLAAGQPHRADLDHPRVGRIKPGGLGVHDDRIDRDQRRRTGPVRHRGLACSNIRQARLPPGGTSCYHQVYPIYWRQQCPRNSCTGSFVALITPFNKDGSVDFAAFRTLLKFQEDNGTSAVLIMGSTGEASMLSPEEKKKIIVETAKMKTAKMPIFFGCTGNNTESTIANVRFAKDNGADGAILAAPAYICAPEDDIERFFLDVADATDLPLGIYNNPPRVKSDLHWDHLLRIFKHPNYVVHKESTARVGQVAQVLAGKPDVAVMCCDSPNLGLVVPTMSLGGHGTANMTGNIAPAELATISTPWTSYEEAENFKNAYLGLLPLLHYTYSAINPVAVKSLMKALGMPAGDLRKPLTGLEGEALAKGVRIVSELGLDKQLRLQDETALGGSGLTAAANTKLNALLSRTSCSTGHDLCMSVGFRRHGGPRILDLRHGQNHRMDHPCDAFMPWPGAGAWRPAPHRRWRKISGQHGERDRALSAGGSVDGVARILVQKLNETVGQHFIVENRAGGASGIGRRERGRARRARRLHACWSRPRCM